MTLSERNLFDQYTAIDRAAGRITVLVAILDWPQPSQPRTAWKPVRTLAAGSSEAGQTAARLDLLKDRRFFLICENCQKRQPKGHMFSSEICQSCASEEWGVVY